MRKRSARPLIDVVIPAYNAGKTIEASLRSICDQTLSDIRLIVVNDGSTDDTGDILRRMASEDDRIDVITTPNRGIVDALNTAFKHVDADIVARFDADDIAFPNRFEVQYAYLRDHPECAAVGCNVYFTNDRNERTGDKSNFQFNVPNNPFHAPACEPYLLHPFLMVRRQAKAVAGPYRYAFHSEDADLYWRLGDAGLLINLPDFLGEYRLHAGSVSGLSALNGRVSAVNSQLAAVSEQRRRAGLPELRFERETLAEYHEAQTLAGILDIASRQLNAEEGAFLAIATSAKLLELSEYRPYRLTADDFATIRAMISKHHHLLTRPNRLRLLFRQVIMPKKTRMRAWNELSTLMPFHLYPRASVELFAHAATKGSRKLGQLVGRQPPVSASR